MLYLPRIEVKRPGYWRRSEKPSVFCPLSNQRGGVTTTLTQLRLKLRIPWFFNERPGISRHRHENPLALWKAVTNLSSSGIWNALYSIMVAAIQTDKDD